MTAKNANLAKKKLQLAYNSHVQVSKPTMIIYPQAIISGTFATFSHLDYL
jgi:hypothetical protein